MAGPLFIGIDGGATLCRSRIRDLDGNLLGEGAGGPANIHSNANLARQSVRVACERALQTAGLDESSVPLLHVGLGLAGAGIKSACERFLSNNFHFSSVVLETDAYAAWLGAHQGEDGAIVILGTGSCGFGIVNGNRVSVAGWGANISDEAGGQRMGREALRRALWAYDGRVEQSELSIAILDQFKWEPSNIVSFASTATPADYAKFAPMVFKFAALQDTLAVKLVTEAAEAAEDIIATLKKAGAPAICLVGGLAEPLLPWLPMSIRNNLSQPKSDATDGSILMARRAFFKVDTVTRRAS